MSDEAKKTQKMSGFGETKEDYMDAKTHMVDQLHRVLAEVEGGRVTGLAIIALGGDNNAVTILSGSYKRLDMLGGVSWLRKHLESRIETISASIDDQEPIYPAKEDECSE